MNESGLPYTALRFPHQPVDPGLASAADVPDDGVSVRSLRHAGTEVVGAAAVSSLDEVARGDKLLENPECIRAVKGEVLAYETIRQRLPAGEVEEGSPEVSVGETEPCGRLEVVAEEVARAGTVADLAQEAVVSQALEGGTGMRAVDTEQGAHVTIGQGFATCGMDEKDAVARVKLASGFDLGDPGSFGRGDGAGEGEGHGHGRAVGVEEWRVEQVRGHGVLHQVDTAARILGKSEAAKGFDDTHVSCGVLLAQGCECDRLRERTR